MTTICNVAILNFRIGDIPDEFDIVWPLVLEQKIGTEAWSWLDENTIEKWVEWHPMHMDYGFIVKFSAKFHSKEDVLIYKLKYPESSYAKSY